MHLKTSELLRLKEILTLKMILTCVLLWGDCIEFEWEFCCFDLSFVYVGILISPFVRRSTVYSLCLVMSTMQLRLVNWTQLDCWALAVPYFTSSKRTIDNTIPSVCCKFDFISADELNKWNQLPSRCPQVDHLELSPVRKPVDSFVGSGSSILRPEPP